MSVPRPALWLLCAALTALAYYLVLFTSYGNPYHGGSYLGAVLTEAVTVLAAFACAEVVRTERLVPVRAVAGALGVPLVLVVALTLWYGIRRYIGA